MSPEGGRRTSRDLARAEEDLRRTHRELHGLLERYGSVWTRPVSDGWSPAEVLLHVTLTAERALEGLRVALARGPGGSRGPGLARKALLKSVLITWRLPGDLVPPPESHPEGVQLPPEELGARFTRLTAAFLELLQGTAPELLRRLRHAHSRLGPMTPLEWARFLRIYLRHHELRLDAGLRRQGGGGDSEDSPGGPDPAP